MDQFIAFSKAHRQHAHDVLAVQFTVNQPVKHADISHLNHCESTAAPR